MLTHSFAMRYTLFLLLIGLLFPSVVKAQPLNVVATTPPMHALSAERETAIVIDFDAAVNPASFDSSSAMVFGRWSGVVRGQWLFENENTRARFVAQRAFSAGEMVTVSLARHLATPEGDSLGRGYAWQFWTRPRRASMDLEETARLTVRRPGEGQVQTYGAYAGDFDGDGYTDFAVPNEQSNDVRVFMNDGAGGFGSFTVFPIPGGDRPSTNEGADFNLDGHLDFAVGNSQGDLVSVFMGDGTGYLDGPTNYKADAKVRGLAVLDLDGNGYPDIATTNRGNGTISLFLNDGTGAFMPAQTFDPFDIQPNEGETAASAADANEDGILDLFVGAFESEEIMLFLGDGEGGLTFHTKVNSAGTSWMITTGDVNGDGHVDVVTADLRYDNARVVLGDGQGNLSEPMAFPVGELPLAVDLGDLDGDGDLDLVTSNLIGETWTLYENLSETPGEALFGNPRSLPASSAGSCAVFHDRNNDGALDMTGIDEDDDLLFLFTNTPLSTTATETPPRPSPLTLLQNYPNPFTDRTTLTFRLDRPAAVRLVIYDVLGRAVRTLLDETRNAGEHTLTWDGKDAAGFNVPDGVYFYRLEAAGTSRTQQLLYVKSAKTR